MQPRYIVTLWHGENGSIAYVKDNNNPDECLGSYSTVRFGAAFRRLAQTNADELNRGDDNATR